MKNICSKDLLNKNLQKLKDKFPKEYRFFPKSWNLPKEIEEFTRHFSVISSLFY